MRKEIAVILLAFSTLFAYSQQNNLDFYINTGLLNSPLLKDYQYQLQLTGIDSLRIKAGMGAQVRALTSDSYAPVINGWGYDEIKTDVANIYAGVSVSKELTGNQNRQNQFQALGLQNRAISNAGKITEQELKKNITGQYITAFGSWQQFNFNAEVIQLLRSEEIILRKLTENGVFKQTEYLSFIVNLQQQELQMHSMKNQFRADLSMLNYICGIADTSFLALSDPDLEPDILPDFYRTIFFEQFTIDSLKLRNAHNQIDFSYKPKVSIFADGGYFSSLAYLPYKNFGLNAGFTVSIPVYDGGQRKMQHDKVNISELIRRNYRDFYLSQSSQQINRFLQQLRENQQLSEDISRQITYAQTLIDMYHKLLETGDMRITDYIMAINNYLNAKNMMVENNISKYRIISELNYWNRTK